MFRVTRDWVSCNGCWTGKMLAEVGIAWPPYAGWVDALCGTEITEQQKGNIERLHVERQKRHAERAERREAKRADVYYTWPDGKGGFKGSWNKPQGWPL